MHLMLFILPKLKSITATILSKLDSVITNRNNTAPLVYNSDNCSL